MLSVLLYPFVHYLALRRNSYFDVQQSRVQYELMNGLEDFEDGYELNACDKKLVALMSDLLERAMRAPFMTAAKMVSVAKVLHVLRRLPAVSSEMDVRIDINGPTHMFGDHRIRHDWSIEVEDECITIKSGGHFHRPSTGGDSFTCVIWCAWPCGETEFHDYSENHSIVDDIQPFEEEVAGIDFSERGYSLDVSDEKNTLLEDEDDEYDDDAAENPHSLDDGIFNDSDALVEESLEEFDRVLEQNCIERAASIVDLADVAAVALLDVLPDILPPTRRLNINGWRFSLAIACIHFAVEQLFFLRIGVVAREESIKRVQERLAEQGASSVKVLCDSKYACDAALERLTPSKQDEAGAYAKVLGGVVLANAMDVPSNWINDENVAARIGFLIINATKGWWSD